MCDDETCIGSAAVSAELEERSERAKILKPNLLEHTAIYSGRPAWPAGSHIIIATRDQSESEEWRERDLRQRLRDHQAEFGR